MTFVEYVAGLVRNLSGDLFAFKATWDDFAQVAPHARMLFPDLRVVFIQRRCVEAQALSHYYASKTGHWHARGAEVGTEEKPAHLDLAEIDRIIGRFQSENQGWQKFFAVNGLLPEEFYYEDFRADIDGSIARLAKLGGVQVVEKPARRPPLKKIGSDDDPWLQEIIRHRRSTQSA